MELNFKYPNPQGQKSGILILLCDIPNVASDQVFILITIQSDKEKLVVPHLKALNRIYLEAKGKGFGSTKKICYFLSKHHYFALYNSN